jgi:Carboxypeptidase regulatory-like domain
MLLRSVFLASYLLLLPAGNAIDQSVTPALGQLSGHVYLADTGAPLSDAVVTLDHHPEQRTRTGADGSYSFGSLLPGDYLVVVYKTGFLGSIYNLQGSAPTSLTLKPGEKLDHVDFHLKPAPQVVEMKDDALTATFTSKERLYLHFMYGQFSPGGTRLAIVTGDILNEEFEQVWLYDLGSHQLTPVTDKPTPGTLPSIQYLAWAGNTLYVDGERRMGGHHFVIAASPDKVEEIAAAPPNVAGDFHEISHDLDGGPYVITVDRPSRGGDIQLRARKGKTGPDFTIAAAIQGDPIYDVASATVFYFGDSWSGKIVAFHLNTRRVQELDVPGGGGQLLDVERDGNGFLIAYTVPGSCNIEETPDGEDPWVLPTHVEYRTQHRPAHICFVHLPDKG